MAGVMLPGCPTGGGPQDDERETDECPQVCADRHDGSGRIGTINATSAKRPARSGLAPKPALAAEAARLGGRGRAATSRAPADPASSCAGARRRSRSRRRGRGRAPASGTPRGSGRAARLPDRGRGGARRRRGARAPALGEEGPHDGRVLHDGNDPQPAPTAGTGEDIEGEHGDADGGCSGGHRFWL